MKIHSDTLTTSDLHAALPAGVLANITQKGSRSRAHAYDCTLYVTEKDELHRRLGNSGGYGASSDVAATWDEWGVWLDNLYQRDPELLIPGYYDSYEDFVNQTAWVRNVKRDLYKPHHLEYRTHTAPWLAFTVAGMGEKS